MQSRMHGGAGPARPRCKTRWQSFAGDLKHPLYPTAKSCSYCHPSGRAPRHRPILGEAGMKLGAAIAEIMKREGIEILCGYPVNHIIEFAANAEIRPIMVRQERIGLHLA